MALQVKHAKTPAKASHLVHWVTDAKKTDIQDVALKSAQQLAVKNGVKVAQFAADGQVQTVVITDAKSGAAGEREAIRSLAFQVLSGLNAQKMTSASFVNHTGNPEVTLLAVESMVLSNYQFLELFSDSEAKKNSFAQLALVDPNLDAKQLQRVLVIADAVCWSRDLVNRPLSHLNASDLASSIAAAGEEFGFQVEVLNKQRIVALKMGGLLAVNRGSVDPPTFTIAEYKPKGAVNSKPLVLVGKGVVYDTGGMSLKPTPQSMDFMKSDMAGAAAMAGVLRAVAAMKLPVHVVALIPATDNRTDGNAYVPGDVITMYDGTTVEVKNTDAEGRLLLADALTYAKKYDPLLVIDAATLTGAAVRAIGNYATCVMATADDQVMATLDACGNDTYERLVRFPLWSEYAEEIKSEIADLSNLGKGEGGQISAAKFLEHFTNYPWVHLDIAGPAYLHGRASYRTSGGTATGVRLLVRFIEKHFKV